MVLPRWLVLLVAVWVMAFGAYRLYVAATRRRGGAPDGPGGRGLFGRTGRAHVAYGVLYLVLGGYLVASAFGYGITVRSCVPEAPSSLPAR